ncbi:zinc-finger homeodomain protein 3-like [Camellia sinensis]|uniref:zinc-finger homeodomain protein 3-like n=1 Tax=Camellia sinensis TaxID=4442 RepID=UPI001036858A|nr:zinc-finger homeodomain protein 3-like [Camellia sinensis]
MATVVSIVLLLFATVNAKGTTLLTAAITFSMPPWRISSSAPPPPPQPATSNEENLGDGKVEQEPPEKKRGRARFLDVQIVEMVKYAAVELGWSLEGHNEDDLGEFCEAIEVTRRSFKVWMKNNKNKYLESEESSSSDDSGRSVV